MMSRLIHGCRIAVLVGVVSMGIASIIGILVGAIAGYFGDNRLKVKADCTIVIHPICSPSIVCLTVVMASDLLSSEVKS